MQQTQNIDRHDSEGRPSLSEAASIPSLTHIEAAEMATVELERFLACVEALAPADWDQSTACTLWNVRQVLAHVTGAAASYARWSQFKRQTSLFVQRKASLPIRTLNDALNQIQVDDRRTATPADLLTELHDVGP